MQYRAYGVIEIKSLDEDERVIEGIASTPTPDRVGDIVEPLGAQFKLPLPLLSQHDSREPVGHVTSAKTTEDGIPFRARIAKIDEPGALKDRVDLAWQEVKAGLVRGVSIGFQPLEWNLLKDGGIRFEKWEWLELSLVTIPANQDATIQNIKSLDTAMRAAFGQKRDVVSIRPGAAGKPNPVLSETPMTYTEQISDAVARRAEKAARMMAIMDAAGDKGETLEETGQEEFDGLEAELKKIDEHLARLRIAEKLAVATARQVSGQTPDTGSESRQRSGPIVTQMRNNLEPGIEYTRLVMCQVAAKVFGQDALKLAEHHHPDMPRLHNVLRAQSEGRLITKAPADPLLMGDPASSPVAQYQMITNDFVSWLMPATIVGQLGVGNVPGPFRVPFNIRVPLQTSAARGWWVGEAKAKPVTGFTMDSKTLRPTKVANIIALSEEFFRFAQIAAEQVVRRVMTEALVYTIDNSFIDIMNAGTPDIEPASITYGVTPIPSSGGDFDAARADLAAAIGALAATELSYSNAVWIMNSATAAALGLMVNTLSQPAFPGMTPQGGLLLGRPVVISNVIEATGTPAESYIVLTVPPEIYLADDGGVSIDMSREASLEMSDAPTGTAANVSLWQSNMIGLRAERFINWTMRRPEAVQVITGVGYTTAP